MTHLERPEAQADIATGDPEKYGKWFWAELNEVVDKMPEGSKGCGECKAEGKAALQALRDGIAVSKGRPPYDPENLKRVALRFQQVAEKCIRAGHCHNPHIPGSRPHRLTVCERRNPAVVHKIERCVLALKGRHEVVNPYAVCRSSIPCP